MAHPNFPDLIHRFYFLVTERMVTYQLFDDGHQDYLKSGPDYEFIDYRELLHEITMTFNGINKEIIQMKKLFVDVYERPDLAAHIEKIQDLEKEKLELTCRLQLTKQNVQDHPTHENYQEQEQILKHKLIKNAEALSEVIEDFKYDCEDDMQ
ncbi:required for excision 1-B domain-containing protein [Discoglossus pictus]